MLMDQLRDPLAGDGGDGDDLAAEFGGDASRASAASVRSILVTTRSSGRWARAVL